MRAELPTQQVEIADTKVAVSPLRRNILIFSDGTGQAGGLFPDEDRSNIYKLYRATRCGPDTEIKAAQQIAFYDPGLGSQTDGDRIKFKWGRAVYNALSQATGLGITQNIIDCYSAILKLYRPGDRIFLFGFSRGAYTARCLGGVLANCGVPTKNKDGTPLLRNSENVTAIARAAVKGVYQYKGSIEGNPFSEERAEVAKQFRETYGSADGTKSNAVPYFIGVFDTVATVGAPVWAQWLIGAIALALVSAVFGTAYWYFRELWWAAFVYPAVAAYAGFLIWYFCTHVFWHKSKRKLYFANWRMAFNDTRLNRDVVVARHALAIDESRADFARVPWDWDNRAVVEHTKYAGEPEPLRQLWFSGNHSDIGGSYAENESRLSDVALKWMIEQTQECRIKIQIEPRYMNLSPDPSGPQHDECRVVKKLWFYKFRWPMKKRDIPVNAPLHQSVIDRFKFDNVLVFDELTPYRPDNLRDHQDVKQYY